MFDVIIVANGKSLRTGFDKLSVAIDGTTVLEKTVSCFDGIADINKIIIVSDHIKIISSNIITVSGGKTRTQSVQQGLKAVTADYVLIHDGARPFVTKKLITEIMTETVKYNSAIPCLPVTDSLRVRHNNEIIDFIDRENAISVQTPQGFKTSMIKESYKKATDGVFTDDSEVFTKFTENAHLVLGEESNKKITTANDLFGITAKVGNGFDYHRFCPNKSLVLGGVDVPYPYGLEAHSDGDVVIHALMDALLSAVNERDIGIQFPDSDKQYTDINSLSLLKVVGNILKSKNAHINNASVVIIAQKPKLSAYVPAMQVAISSVLDISPQKINITVTTTENLGLTAENQGIAALSMVSII